MAARFILLAKIFTTGLSHPIRKESEEKSGKVKLETREHFFMISVEGELAFIVTIGSNCVQIEMHLNA